MNTKEMIRTIQIQNGARIVSGVYLNGSAMPMPSDNTDRRRINYDYEQEEPQGSYSFINVNAGELEEGDIVVVQTRDTVSLVRVVNPNQRANSLRVPLAELKYVVDKVNLAGLNELLNAENDAMHKLALSEVTEKLEKFKTQIGGSTFAQVSQGLLAPMRQPHEPVPPTAPRAKRPSDYFDVVDLEDKQMED